jgi:hypothetical protein
VHLRRPSRGAARGRAGSRQGWTSRRRSFRRARRQLIRVRRVDRAPRSSARTTQFTNAAPKRERGALPAAPPEAARVRGTDGRAGAGGSRRARRKLTVRRRTAGGSDRKSYARRGSSTFAAHAASMARRVQARDGSGFPYVAPARDPRRPSGGVARCRVVHDTDGRGGAGVRGERGGSRPFAV